MTKVAAVMVYVGDTIEFDVDGKRLESTIAKIAYSTPVVGRITFTATDGAQHVLRASHRVNITHLKEKK